MKLTSLSICPIWWLVRSWNDMLDRGGLLFGDEKSKLRVQITVRCEC